MSMSPLHRLITLWSWSNGFRLFHWPNLAMSEAKLVKMTCEQLDRAFKHEFEIAVEQYRKADFVMSARGELAIDRCVLFTDRLSELSDGFHGKVFMREVRTDLSRQIRDAVGEGE